MKNEIKERSRIKDKVRIEKSRGRKQNDVMKCMNLKWNWKKKHVEKRKEKEAESFKKEKNETHYKKMS